MVALSPKLFIVPEPLGLTLQLNDVAPADDVEYEASVPVHIWVGPVIGAMLPGPIPTVTVNET